MTKQKILNFLKYNSFAIFMIAIGVAILCIVSKYPEVPSGFGPAFFPRIVAVLSIGLSVICIITNIKKSLNYSASVDKIVALKILFTIVALVVLVLLMKYVHPLVGIFLFLFGYLKIIAKLSWVKTIIISVIGTAGLFGVILLLRIPL